MAHKEAAKKLLQLYKRQQQFCYHLYKRYEEEKTDVTRQLHATLGQSLVVLKLRLQHLTLYDSVKPVKKIEIQCS